MAMRWSHAENDEVDITVWDVLPECEVCGRLYEGNECGGCDVGEEDDMNRGREHDDRRKAQAAAARRHENRARRQSRPGHGQRATENRKAIKESD